MKMVDGLKSNPIWIYISWIFILIVLGQIGILILSKISSGGDPLIFLGHVLDVAIYGLLILSFVASFVFCNWFQKILVFEINKPLFDKLQDGEKLFRTFEKWSW